MDTKIHQEHIQTIRTNKKKTLIFESAKRIIIDLIKKRDVFIWGIIVPIIFFLVVTVVFTLAHGGKGVDSSNLSALTLCIIHFSTLVLTMVLIADKITEDKDKGITFEPYELIGRFLAHLACLCSAIILLLIMGLLIGVKFAVTLSTIMTSLYFFFLLILVSFGLGLTLTKIRKYEIVVMISMIITIVSTIFFILASVRPNFFNRFPTVFREILQIIPFISNSAAIISSLVGENFTGGLSTLNGGQILFVSLTSLLLFFIGVTLYLRNSEKKKEKSVVKIKKESMTDYLKPALIASIFLSLRYVLEFVIALFLFFSKLVEDISIQKLIISLVSPILGFIIIYILLLPLLNLKKVEFKSLKNRISVINTIGIFSILWLGLIISAIIFVTISSLFGISNILFFNLTSITLNQSDNIIDIFLWLIALTIGVASLKELLYRRTLIPMLESQELGMSSFTVIMTSGLGFGLLHLPQSLGIQASLFQSDLISFSFKYDPQTTIIFATYQFWVAFLIGIACSTTYVFTRNVIYPIMIHTMTNLLFLISYSFAIFEN
ncbi:MAG: CPBP family glutamic-type intramembrane protease, partial [Candidatus Hodarchaeales archaeon]